MKVALLERRIVKSNFLRNVPGLAILLWPLVMNSIAFGAPARESLTTARQEAEAKGLVFLAAAVLRTTIASITDYAPRRRFGIFSVFQ